MLDHLRSRHMNPDRYGCYFDNEVCTFFLYNLSGQLVGYQNYRPRAEKFNPEPKLARYFTYVSPGQLGVWGLETLNYSKVLCVTEGVFDACRLHNLGFAAVAVLSNNNLQVKTWLHSLGREVLVFADNDAAGKKLLSFGHRGYLCPNKDLGEMTPEELCNFVLGKLL